MELGQFIHQEKSVKITGIQPGQWFACRQYMDPVRVFECHSVTENGTGVVRAVTPEGHTGIGYFSSWDCWVLDEDYTPEQLKVLQDRAQTEHIAHFNRLAQERRERSGYQQHDHG